jgi:hypothetical protein
MAYDDFRTGETFATVRQSMRVGTDDPTQWRNKRRRGVLGRWRELKVQLWDWHIHECKEETVMAKKSDNKAAEVEDIDFVRTDETLRFSWETQFAALKPGQLMEFEGHDFAKVRSRALAYTAKTDIVLEVARKNGVAVVRLAPKVKAA